MRITVNGKDRHAPIKLLFPTGLVFNRLTVHFIPMALKDSDVKITRQQALRLFREVKRCKKEFHDWKIVEVESADGEYVEVKL